jgi:L-ascorbate metabolism protein UlaG (beta-lactamase superfamily)
MLSTSDMTELTWPAVPPLEVIDAEAAPGGSDHFDGRSFFNPGVPAGRGWLDLLRAALTARPRPWPRFVENTARAEPVVEVPVGRVVLTFINHITFLIQLHGLNILTDPVYAERVSPLRHLGPRRVRPPGLPFAELPRIDVVLISHDHYDHLDVETLRRLEAAHHPRFMTGLGNGALLRRIGLREVHESDWWQRTALPSATVTFTPAQHWSGRGLLRCNRSLWGGFHVRAAGAAVYFAGDTGYCRHFQDIRRRLGAVDVALLPIGAYAPRWYEAPNHMNPEEAVRAHLALGARFSVATHFGCFRLSEEGIDEPLQELAAARLAQGVSGSAFVALETGETRHFEVTGREQFQPVRAASVARQFADAFEGRRVRVVKGAVETVGGERAGVAAV